MDFPTDYKSILERLHNIDPVAYGRTRNFIDGAVTYLSPYISRGVISLAQVKEVALQKGGVQKTYKFLQELAWRAYWQSVWRNIGDTIFTDIKHPQPDFTHEQMPDAIVNATTGINAIDEQIFSLYDTGYLHNHLRMYVASITCNIAQSHWLHPAQWLYYHLLDGDLASNHLSWQWVAGSFSTKKYYCNQENIDRYTHTEQRNTFLDLPYPELVNAPVPEVLKSLTALDLKTKLPVSSKPILTKGSTVLVYNSYNLDPLWHQHETADRILLLEPTHFAKFPVSEKVLDFILKLSENIKDIQIFCGEFSDLQQLAADNNCGEITFKSHPSSAHYAGTEEPYEHLFPEVTKSYASFFSYWKNCEKILKAL